MSLNIEFVQAFVWTVLSIAGCIILGRDILRRILRRR